MNQNKTKTQKKQGDKAAKIILITFGVVVALVLGAMGSCKPSEDDQLRELGQAAHEWRIVHEAQAKCDRLYPTPWWCK